MNEKSYRICTRCVMDTSDPRIEFDEHGVCSHCRRFDELLAPNWMPDERGAQRLRRLSEQIRAYGRGREYDCAIGVSGGVDSSYLLYVAKEMMQLRPLAVHVDAGWNSELAVRNIENLTKGLDIDLFTYVVDWEEMRDLQVAYLKAAVPNQDVPQDHAFVAKLYEFAVDRRIKYVLTGSNIATESILPQAWGYNATDSRQLRAIHKRFGSRPLDTFPDSGLLRSYLYYPYIRGMKVVRPLDRSSTKGKGHRFLSSASQDYYGRQHSITKDSFSSRTTSPRVSVYDKRRAHLAISRLGADDPRSASPIGAPPYAPALAARHGVLARNWNLRARVRGASRMPNESEVTGAAEQESIPDARQKSFQTALDPGLMMFALVPMFAPDSASERPDAAVACLVADLPPGRNRLEPAVPATVAGLGRSRCGLLARTRLRRSAR